MKFCFIEAQPEMLANQHDRQHFRVRSVTNWRAFVAAAGSI